MNDREGKPIHDGDHVRFQYAPDSAVHIGRVLDAGSHRAKELKAVKVSFSFSGHPQFIGVAHLTVVEKPCGRCGKGEAAGAAGLCAACNRLADASGS